jgi:two-component system nitrate/nitrite response regulator NarL
MSAFSDNSGRDTITSLDEIAASARDTLRVAIVDDHKLLAETLVELLVRFSIDARAVIGDTHEAILEALEDDLPDIAIVDFHLGDLGSATPLIAPLTHRGCEVVVVTGDMTRLTAAECYEAGAKAVITKGMPVEELLAAVDLVNEGRRMIDDAERHALLTELRLHRSSERSRRARFAELTPRESAVLRHICNGLSAAEVAEVSFVSLATVRSQIRSILTKLGVGSQLAAATEAYQSGWVDLYDESSNLPM